MNINIGISESDRLQTAQQLKGLLADTYTLYLQTHNFHWNVTGPLFQQLHQLFETQYTELALAVDEIAERIRTLGVVAPGTYSSFSELATVKEIEGVPNAQEMIKTLLENNERIVRVSREALKVAQDTEDESSAALISDRMRVHEKAAWMLRASL